MTRLSIFWRYRKNWWTLLRITLKKKNPLPVNSTEKIRNIVLRIIHWLFEMPAKVNVQWQQKTIFIKLWNIIGYYITVNMVSSFTCDQTDPTRYFLCINLVECQWKIYFKNTTFYNQFLDFRKGTSNSRHFST